MLCVCVRVRVLLRVGRRRRGYVVAVLHVRWRAALVVCGGSVVAVLVLVVVCG